MRFNHSATDISPRFFRLATALLIAAVSSVGAGEQTSELTFTFPREDLQITKDKGYDAVSLQGASLLEDEPGNPWLPARYVNILIPSNSEITDVRAAAEAEYSVADGLNLLPVQPPAALSLPKPAFVLPDPEAYRRTDRKPLYRRGQLHRVRDMQYLSVRLNPVRLIPATGELYLAEKIKLTVTYNVPEITRMSTRSASTPEVFRESVLRLVENPEGEGAQTATPESNPATRSATSSTTREEPVADCQYLIITNDTLASAFQALADHRNSHSGYSTEVRTVSSITDEYNGADTQDKIRNCIIDYVNSHGTLYVVLGGDNSVVPDRDCTVSAGGNTETQMPTDLYYAGLDGNWDTDGDGVYGETANDSGSGADEADLAADVYLGRIPVRAAAQATAYIDKLINYETTPGVAEAIGKKFLISGEETFRNYSGDNRPADTVPDGHLQFTEHDPVSDAEVLLRRMYRDSAHPYWRANTIGILTDTLTSWDGGSAGDYAASPSHMVDRFSDGWSMVINGTHGNGTILAAEGGNFKTSHASALTDLTAFFYTYACLTGKFDKDEPSLSEAMLRNGNGGALAYIGSSRYNYSGTGYRYQEEFLRNVFENHTTNVAQAFYDHKATFAAQADNSSATRWLQFSLNLQGDPAVEMVLSDGTNNAPIAHDQSLSVSAPVGIVLEGTDWDKDPLDYTLTSSPAHGTITGTPPNLTYEPDEGYIGSDSFTFIVNDGTVDSEPATISISVEPPLTAYWPMDEMDGNYLPDATGNGYKLSFSQSEIANDAGVFGNAACLNEGNGPIKSSSSPRLPFTGAADASLALWFNCDNAHDLSRHQVLFDLGGVWSADDADPEKNIIAYIHGLKLYVIVNGRQFSTSAIQEDTWHHLVLALQVEEGTGNGEYTIYLDGENVDDGSYPAGKEITDGYFQLGAPSYQAYYHDVGPYYEYGVDWFGGMFDDVRFYSREIEADLVFNLSHAPRSVEDTYTTTEDTGLAVPAPGVLANDDSPRGHVLDAVLHQETAHGTVELQADGGFDYMPDTDFVGTDTFTYRATDGARQGETTTVTLVVNLPDPWRNADIGTPDTVGSAHFDNDSANLVVDGASGDIGSTADGSHFVYRTLFGDGQIVARIVSQENTSGAAKAGVMIRETLDGGSPRAFMGVTPGEGALFVTRDTINGDSSETAAGTHAAPHWVKLVRLGNTLTGYESSDGTTWHQVGTATVSMSNEVFLGMAACSNVADERSTAEFNNIDTSAEVNAVADDFTIDEDETLDSTPASLLDSDDGFELTAALETPPSRGTASVNADGTFTYTPDENYNGTDSFTYTATDAQSNTDTGTVTITINPVNDAPEGVEDEYYTDVNATLVVDDVANGVLANDSDPEGDPLTASLRYDTNGTATLNADGTFTFEPDTDFLGSASFSYKVEDDKGAYDYATTVTVNVGGYAPVADQGDEGAGSFTIVDEDNDGMVIVTLDGTASYDPDGTIVGYRWYGDIDEEFTTATAEIDLEVGSEPYIYLEVTDDDGLTTTRGVRYYIVNENDAPTADADSFSTIEDTALHVTAPGVLVNDTDPDPQVITAVLQAKPANGNLSLKHDGSFDYTPQPGFYGADSFTYTAFDGELHSDPATVSITVDYADTDADNMPDTWEQQIVDADPNDGISTIEDVQPDEDFDGDGRSNLLEYALNLDPTSSNEPNAPQAIVTIDGHGSVFADLSVYLRSDDDNLAYALETCTDLSEGAWSGDPLQYSDNQWRLDGDDEPIIDQVDLGSGLWHVTIELPATPANAFFRVGLQNTEYYDIIGRRHIDLQPGYNFLGMNFKPTDHDQQGFGIQNLFDTSTLTGGTTKGGADQIYLWNAAEQQYDKLWLFDSQGDYPDYDGTWLDAESGLPAQDVDIANGNGFWFVNRSEEVEHGVFIGRVESAETVDHPATGPDDSQTHSYNMMASAYPVDQPINQMDWSGLSGGTNQGGADQLLLWDAANQQYQRFWLFDSGGDFPEYDDKWFDTATGKVAGEDCILGPADAVWILKQTADAVAEPKPF